MIFTRRVIIYIFMVTVKRSVTKQRNKRIYVILYLLYFVISYRREAYNRRFEGTKDVVKMNDKNKLYYTKLCSRRAHFLKIIV